MTNTFSMQTKKWTLTDWTRNPFYATWPGLKNTNKTGKKSTCTNIFKKSSKKFKNRTLIFVLIQISGCFYLFFTPTPCTYTSSWLDAWLGISIIFIYMEMQDHVIYRDWIHFIPTSLYPRREEKHFGLSWNWTKVLLLHKQPLWPLDHGSSGKLRGCYGVSLRSVTFFLAGGAFIVNFSSIIE